jgi:hypothetical protein
MEVVSCYGHYQRLRCCLVPLPLDGTIRSDIQYEVEQTCALDLIAEAMWYLSEDL